MVYHSTTIRLQSACNPEVIDIILLHLIGVLSGIDAVLRYNPEVTDIILLHPEGVVYQSPG